MKKFLKIAVVLMAVFAMTNFIACSTGSDSEGTGSSSEAGGETGGTGSGGTGGTGSGETGGSGSSETPVAGEYKVVYEGVAIDKETYTLEEAKALAAKYGLAEKTDYTIDEAKKEIVLTASGMAKVDAAMGGGSSETPVAGEYKVVYEGVAVMEGLTLEAANAMATEFGLIENTDYTINNETKTITLTASGMAKVEAAESGNPGAGDEPSGPGAGTEKLNLTVDITTLTFAEATAGLTDTADPAKNGTYMIPTTAKILDALTPTKDDKAFWYTNKDRNKISALQLNADGELAFVLTNPATVKVTFLSTGDTNTSAITINGTQNSVTGKTAQEFTWEIAAAGIYTIASTGTSNARITAISIVEK